METHPNLNSVLPKLEEKVLPINLVVNNRTKKLGNVAKIKFWQFIIVIIFLFVIFFFVIKKTM